MSNLAQRILSAMVLVPFVLALVFFASTPIYILGISFISALAGFEFFSCSITPPSKSLSFLDAFLCAVVTGSISFAPLQPTVMLIALPIVVILLFLSTMFLNKSPDEAVRALSFSFFGVFYVGVLTSFLGLIASSAPVTANGRFAILLLLLGTFLGDTGAYTFGRIFGKHKLAPRLSPKKTWEGAFGGLLATMIAVFAVRFFALPMIPLFLAVLLSFFLSISCQLGDLAESFFKRGVGVKDSGNLIPGHGGMLDRIDALLFGAPVVYFFTLLF